MLMTTWAGSAVSADCQVDGRVTELSGFQYAGAEFQAGQSVASQLKQVASTLNRCAEVSITISGHTDNSGANDLNEAISLSRATAVWQSLRQLGVAANRMQVQGFGEQMPAYDNSTRAGRRKNRRVEILFSSSSRPVENVQVSNPAPVIRAPVRQGGGIPSAVRQVFPKKPLESFVPSSVAGWYEVRHDGDFLYLSEDGRYMMQGDLIDMISGESLTEKRRTVLRKNLIDSIGEENMIIFAPEKPSTYVTVFTDIDCGYCRKMHREMQQYMDLGIAVRYLFFPRSGPGGASFKKARNVWCAADRKEAMTIAKAGKNLPQKGCANPVLEHYLLGKEVGLRGTPMTILEDGSVVGGYIPASTLGRVLAESQN